jgi:hypothetical protein
MGIKRHRPEEIVTKLRQVEVLVGQGHGAYQLRISPQFSKMKECAIWCCLREDRYWRWDKWEEGTLVAFLNLVGLSHLMR